MREGFTAFNPIGALEAMAQQRIDEANGAKLRVMIYSPLLRMQLLKRD